MARFLSLKNLLRESTETARRFPMALLSAVTGALVAVYMTELRNQEAEKEWAALLLVCSLGLTFFFSLSIFSERKAHSLSKKTLLQASGLLLLAGYYFYLRNWFVEIEFIRYALLNIALHLFASFAAYTGRNNLKGFWQFNKALFLRVFFGGVYSATLFLGLCLAIAAIDKLFNARIDERTYFQLWIIIVGIFNTWFFLAGVPKNLADLDHSDDYPKGLKIFTQYVLLPLVTLYLVILYVYMGKIIFTQNLPKGWVSYLVIGFSVAGILALLLIHPIRKKEGNRWIDTFSRWFYGALYPLVVMLFIAISRRISDYGVTENRYFIIVLAIWLFFVSSYFLFTRVSNIKYIPVSLCFIALFCSFGPWGAFAVSERSQFNTLEKILTDNKVLVSGKVDTKHSEVPDSVAEQVTSIVKYFNEMHGFEKFKPWFNQDIDSLIADSLRWNRVANIMKLLKITELYNYDRFYDEDNDGVYNRYFSYYAEANSSNVKDISGYDYEINFHAEGYSSYGGAKYVLQKDTFTLQILDSLQLQVRRNGLMVHTLNLDEFLRTINDSCKKQSQYNSSIPQRFMERVMEDSLVKIKLQFNGIYGYQKNKKYKTQNASGNCLLKLRSAPPR